MHPSDIVRKYIRPGDTLAERYQIEGFLGSGAYGSIFSAIDTVSMERVAVKALPPSEGVRDTALGRFQREMKVISSLRHSNIINMYDFGETRDRIGFMVMEYIDGPTLYDVVGRAPLSHSEAISVTKQIAMGLKAAHDLGIIHRDLKPQNVMLIEEREGHYKVKVLDFGMAKLLQRLGDESIIQLTREGVAVGTPRYIAPEQARGKTVGPYSDLYALGLLMYEMFTGERAVKADSIETAIMAHVSREPLQLDELHDVPEFVRPVLFRLIEKNPKKRYQDAGHVIADLEALEYEARVATGAGLPRKQGGIGDSDSHAETEEHRVRSIHSASRLELDYDRFNKFAPPEQPKKRRKKRDPHDLGVPLLRLPEQPTEWAETALALILLPIAFVLVTAHFYESGAGLRYLIGAIPALTAAVASLAAHTSDWRWGFFRLLLIANVAAVLGSHLVLTSLVIGLVKDAAWFLAPFEGVPGVSLVADMIRMLCKAHVAVLFELSPKLVAETRNLLG